MKVSNQSGQRTMIALVDTLLDLKHVSEEAAFF